ncbi:MAG: NAD-dependent epimerase/dehydratase family protein [Actinomycetota bacterium]
MSQSNRSSTRERSALVTGAAGFIGSHLVERLLAGGSPVTGIDSFDPFYDERTKRANLATSLSDPRFRLIEGDVGGDRGGDLIRSVRPDVVFHLAGRAGVQVSWGDGFAAACRSNIEVTQSVFEACLDAGVRRVVYASSSSIYGSSASSGGERIAQPVSPYGVTKLAGEQLAAVYRGRGLEVTSLRYFTVYGPRQRPDMAMHRLFEAARADGSAVFELRGDGSQRREFTFVGDVVEATCRAGAPDVPGDLTVDVGGGAVVSLSDVIALVGDIAGRPVRSRLAPLPAGDPTETRADTSEAARRLGWRPATSLRAGLESQWHWHHRRVVAGLGMREAG